MNYSSLKSDIAAVVKQNGNQEITGENLQGVLTEMIDNSVGTGYLYKGIATPETQGGTPDQNVFYLAGAGTYGNFGGTIIPQGSFGVFKYDGAWSVNIIEIVGFSYAVQYVPQTLSDEQQAQARENISAADSSLLTTIINYDDIITQDTDLQIQENVFLATDLTTPASNGYRLTDYIPVVQGTEITYKLFAVSAVMIVSFYDADKTYITNSGITGAGEWKTETIQVPTNAVYVRFSYSYASSSIQSGTYVTMSLLGYVNVGELSERVDELEDEVQSSIGVNVGYTDILTQDDELVIQENVFLATDLTTPASNGYRLTDYIPVVQGTEITYKLFAVSAVMIVSFYDADKTYITNSGITGAGEWKTETIQVPTNAVYVRFSYYYGSSSIQSGTYVTMYELKFERYTYPIPDEDIFSVFGDSISSDEIIASTHAHADGLAYPRTLANLLGMTLDRWTIPGTGVAQLKQNVFNSNVNAKLVIVMYGINNSSLTLGDIDTIMNTPLADLANDTTFLGMYRYSLESLRNRLTNPNALICCISPCTNYHYDNPNGQYTAEWLTNMRAGIKEFVLREGGPNAGWFYIEGTQILPWDSLYFIATTGVIDNTHPNTEGEAIMAHEIYNRLPNIELYNTRR